VPYDIGYGGAFYALVDAGAIGLSLADTPLDRLVEAADRITKHVAATVPLEHPDDADLAFLYGTILTDGGDGSAGRPGRNVCVFAEREVDRSPTGSGVSARVAVQCARGLPLGEKRVFESLTGAVFSATPVRRDRVGRFEAVRVEVGGRAFYSGRSSFTVEPGDPLGGGFLLR
jgi:trans-L-3-hydroxyproline dehydratase